MQNREQTTQNGFANRFCDPRFSIIALLSSSGTVDKVSLGTLSLSNAMVQVTHPLRDCTPGRTSGDPSPLPNQGNLRSVCSCLGRLCLLGYTQADWLTPITPLLIYFFFSRIPVPHVVSQSLAPLVPLQLALQSKYAPRPVRGLLQPSLQ